MLVFVNMNFCSDLKSSKVENSLEVVWGACHRAVFAIHAKVLGRPVMLPRLEVACKGVVFDTNDPRGLQCLSASFQETDKIGVSEVANHPLDPNHVISPDWRRKGLHPGTDEGSPAVHLGTKILGSLGNERGRLFQEVKVVKQWPQQKFGHSAYSSSAVDNSAVISQWHN